MLTPPTPPQVRELIGEGNSGQFTARGGSIDFDFFCNLMQKKVLGLQNEDELKDAFRVLDSRGQGWITPTEMKLVCAKLGENMEVEEVDAMISEAISNYVRVAIPPRGHPATCPATTILSLTVHTLHCMAGWQDLLRWVCEDGHLANVARGRMEHEKTLSSRRAGPQPQRDGQRFVPLVGTNYM